MGSLHLRATACMHASWLSTCTARTWERSNSHIQDGLPFDNRPKLGVLDQQIAVVRFVVQSQLVKQATEQITAKTFTVYISYMKDGAMSTDIHTSTNKGMRAQNCHGART